MIKILFIISELALGGAENILLQLLSSLDKEKFQLFVLCLSSWDKVGNLLGERGVAVNYLSCKSVGGSLFSIFKLLKYTKKVSPDPIQGWMYHGNFGALVAGKLQHIPLLWNIRHTPYVLKDEKLTIRLLIKAGAFFSHYVQKVIYCSTKVRNNTSC